jgi:radical SAM protein with 4Fe4S-binding SPASM domain
MIRGNHRSFDEALSSIERFASEGVYVDATLTATSLNYREIPEIYELVSSRGAKHLGIKIVRHVRDIVDPMKILGLSTTNEEELKRILEEMKADDKNILDGSHSLDVGGKYTFFGCPAGRFYARTDVNGNLYACSYATDIIGNVVEDGFRNVWDEYNRRIFMGDLNCKYSHRCCGPCQISHAYKRDDFCND